MTKLIVLIALASSLLSSAVHADALDKNLYLSMFAISNQKPNLPISQDGLAGGATVSAGNLVCRVSFQSGCDESTLKKLKTCPASSFSCTDGF